MIEQVIGLKNSNKFIKKEVKAKVRNTDLIKTDNYFKILYKLI